MKTDKKIIIESAITLAEVKDVLKHQNILLMYGASGYLVRKTIEGKMQDCIFVDSFDELKLNAASICYGNNHENDVSAEVLKDAFEAQDPQ